MAESLYVGVYPEPSTEKWLKLLVKGAPFSAIEKKFHVTVMYCKVLRAGITYKMMEDLADPEKEFMAFADSVKIWRDHKGRDIVVLSIRSSNLLLRERFWAKSGATHDYAIWVPHVTLSNPLSPEEVTNLEMQGWMKDINQRLLHRHFSMLFTDETTNPIKSSSLESSLEEALSAIKNPLRKKNKKRRNFAPPMKRAHLSPIKRVGPVPKEMKEMKMPRLSIERPYMKEQRQQDKERHEKAKEREDALMET